MCTEQGEGEKKENRDDREGSGEASTKEVLEVEECHELPFLH